MLGTLFLIMGKQIIRQPNGKYCIFSSIVDSLTDINCTEEEILSEYQFQFGINGKKRAKEIINQLENSEKPYFHFTMTFEEMLKTVESIHGKEDVEKLLHDINCA